MSPARGPGEIGDTDTPDVVIDVYALRTFYLSLDMHLLPVTDPSSDWVGGTCVADCRAGRSHGPAPVDYCTCGIYAVKNLDNLNYPSARGLVAVVRLEGPTIEGDLGYRAAAARVVALWIAPGVVKSEEHSKLQANLPGVPFFDGLDDMVDHFPGVDRTANHHPPAPTPLQRIALRAARTLAAGLRLGVGPAFTVLFCWLSLEIARQLSISPDWLPGSNLSTDWTPRDAIYAVPKVVNALTQSIAALSVFTALLTIAVSVDAIVALFRISFGRRNLRFSFTASRKLLVLGIAAPLVSPNAAGSAVVLAFCLSLGISALLASNRPFTISRGPVIQPVKLMGTSVATPKPRQRARLVPPTPHGSSPTDTGDEKS